MLESIRGKLGLLFLAFVVLLLISVGATYWGLETQQQDALVINLAGRQRMLIQQMNRLARDISENDTETSYLLLQESEAIFSQTLRALRNGGSAPYLSDSYVVLPGTENLEIQIALDDLEIAWSEYQTNLDAVTASGQGTSALQKSMDLINEQAASMVEQADLIVRLFQAESVQKVNLLRYIQISFLACAAILLLTAGWVTRQSLLQPLNQLEHAAKRLGNNDLTTPVNVNGSQEIHSLSNYFDLMRLNLLTSQQELVDLNETLEKRVTQRTLELEALNQVSQEIISELDVSQVLNSVTEKARQLLAADIATLCLLDSKSQWLNLEVLTGPDAAVRESRAPARADFTAHILKDSQARLCASEDCLSGCQILTENYRASHIAAPLQVGEKVIGAFCVGSPHPNHFTEESAESLTKLANTAAIALENARLYSQAERIAALEERNRIAAEIHDGIGQTLSYLGLVTDEVMNYVADNQEEVAVELLRKIRKTINQAAQETRQAINHLLDDHTINMDLCARLEESIKKFSRQYQLPVNWQNNLTDTARCSREISEQVNKIVLEALTNIKRHANADQVFVELDKDETDFFVTVSDNGQGFTVTSAGKNGHFGLQIMQARAAHVDGEVRVESNPGVGTQVTVSWPLEKSEPS